MSIAIRRVSSATEVPMGLALKVECVDPGGKTVGLMYSSLAQTPLSGFRPLVTDLPKIITSGVTPKCSIAHSLPVRYMPIKLWAIEHFGVTPDVMIFGKSV